MTGRGPLGTRVWAYGRVGARVGPRPASRLGPASPPSVSSPLQWECRARLGPRGLSQRRRGARGTHKGRRCCCSVRYYYLRAVRAAPGPGAGRGGPEAGAAGASAGAAGSGMGGAHGRERGPGRVCAGTRRAPPAAAARARPDPVTPGDSPAPWLRSPASKTPPGTSCPTVFQVAFASQKSLRTFVLDSRETLP